MAVLHIAQVNIARMKAPLDDPLMAGFGRPNSRSRSRACRRATELLKNSECRIQNRELRNEICSTFFILNSEF
jgi:hypothetical protein